MGIQHFLTSRRLRRATGIFFLSLCLGIPMVTRVVPVQAAGPCMDATYINSLISNNTHVVDIDIAGCVITVSTGSHDGPGPTAFVPIDSGKTVIIYSSVAGGEISTRHRFA